MTTLRAGTESDRETVAGLFQDARAQAMPWLPVLHTSDEDVAFFGGLLASGAVTVAEADGVVVGFAAQHAGWLDHLYVAPQHQARGVGRTLLDHVKAEQPQGFMLWAFAENHRARAFYEQAGLVRVEETDGSGNEERTPDVRYEWQGEAQAQAQAQGQQPR